MRDIDRLIDLNNYKFSKGNPYGFTDIKRSKIKKEDTKRIAILGDSFVWGDGLPYDQTWSHKLSEMIRNHGYDNYEVMSCGRNGWSTKDELNWLVDHGFEYEIDILILAWTANDLDFEISHRDTLSGKTLVCSNLLKSTSLILLNSQALH